MNKDDTNDLNEILVIIQSSVLSIERQIIKLYSDIMDINQRLDEMSIPTWSQDNEYRKN